MTHVEGKHRVWWALCVFLALSSVAVAAFAQPVQGGSGAPVATSGVVGIIVKLEDDPVVSYRGTVAGLPATSPQVTGAARFNDRATPVQAYRAYLDRKHAAFEATATAVIPGARVTYRYETVLGGIAMRVPADQLARVAQLPGVKAVYRDRLLKLHTDKSPTFITAKPLWTKLGGQDEAGEGVVVGILDSGIWPEHPSFSDPDPKGKPYPPPPTPLLQCNLDAYMCRNKLIGAYRFMASHDQCVATGGCVNLPGEFASARDSQGHGTHTASTVAGNGLVEADTFGVDRGKVSGIAPRAHVIAYKVCGNGGCLASDCVAAIQQAIIDNVDVINFSISGGEDPYNDAVELAFKDAYAAGVFVAASAGNEGPSLNTMNHRGPWVTTVGASTENRSFLSTLTLVATDKKKLKLTGASITLGLPTAAPVVVNTDTFCASAAPPGSFAGKIVVCERGGGVTRIQKGFNVRQGNAAGMILYNDLPAQELLSDNHWLPSVNITNAGGLALLAFLGTHPGVTATFTDGKAKRDDGDVMAAFSSRGGTAFPLGVSKPDITAPGVQILAGTTPQPAAVVSGPPGELFQAIAGTSMSSPHIAGAAALLKHLHPEWTPGQIKSAMMTTASTKNLFKEDGVTPFAPFDAGSGRVELKEAMGPGLTFDVPVADYNSHEDDLWNVNYPSVYIADPAPNALTVQRTAKSLLAVDSVWKLTVIQDPTPGLTVTAPATLTVPANGSASLNIGINKTGIPANETRHAMLQLKYKSFLLQMPIGAAGPVARPDLIVTAVATPAGGTRGSGMFISTTVGNQGTLTATGFQIQFYLSQNDATLGASDRSYGFCNVSSLAVNAAFTCQGTLTIPSDISPGTYSLIVKVDDEEAVVESIENNNTRASSSSFTIN